MAEDLRPKILLATKRVFLKQTISALDEPKKSVGIYSKVALSANIQNKWVLDLAGSALIAGIILSAADQILRRVKHGIFLHSGCGAVGQYSQGFDCDFCCSMPNIW